MKRTKQDKRPPSDNFVDLHVFVVPHELWMEKYRTTYNNSTLESVSAGFVRVAPALYMCDLRTQIKEQLGGGDILPEDYVFLRCVGRCLAVVSKLQEYSLKVKHFIPPVVPCPELFVLLGTHESLSYSLASSINNGSDIPDYVVGRYVNNSRENNDGSRCSSDYTRVEGSPEIKDETRTGFESADNNKRRVHFETKTPETENPNEMKHHVSAQVTIETKDDIKENVRKNKDEGRSEIVHETVLERSFDNQASGGRLLSNERSLQPERDTEFENGRQQDQLKETQVVPNNNNIVPEREPKSEANTQKVEHNKQSSVEKAHDDAALDTANNAISTIKQRKAKKPLVHSKTSPAFFPRTSNETSQEIERENTYEAEEVIVPEPAVENNETLSVNNDRFQDEVSANNNEDFRKTRPRDDNTSFDRSIDKINDAQNTANEKENDLNLTLGEKENLVLQLQAELNAVRNERSNSEKKREQLLKKAKNLQNQNNQKRAQARNIWKKKYFEEKKITVSLEERCNQLRYDVDVLHKKILSSVDSKETEGTNGPTRHDGDPNMVNNKVLLTRKENEVEELKRRVEEAKIRLGSEMKLRDNAQKELKQIRDEVIDKKINATLVKKSLSLLETRPSNTQI